MYAGMMGIGEGSEVEEIFEKFWGLSILLGFHSKAWYRGCRFVFNEGKYFKVVRITR